MICKKCQYELQDGWIVCPVCGTRTVKNRSTKKRGNGQGTAKKRGNTWTGIRAGYSYLEEIDGKMVLKRKRPTKGGFKTKTEALLWASDDTEIVTSPKLIELWESYSKNDMLKLSHDKQVAYKIARKRLEPVINKRIDLITLDELQEAINNACDTYYPAKDIRDLLSNLYQRAMASNTSIVKQNLSKFLVLPDKKETEAEPFTQDEVTKIWDIYHRGDIIAGFTLLMIYTGMMPSELMRLEKSMINELEIRGVGAKTKVRRKAVIVIPSFMAPVMEALMNYAPASAKLYPVNKDRFYEQYYASIERAGVRKLPPYSCRHTYGTEMVKAGLHPAMVQKLLRHSNQKTQEKYTHLTVDEERKAVDGVQMVDNVPAGH